MAVGKRLYAGEPIFPEGNGFFGGKEIANPGTPPTGEWWLYIDSTTHGLVVKSDGGTLSFNALPDPVPPANGGTGLTSWTQGDIPYFTSGTALSKLAKNTSTQRVVTNGGASNAPSWAQVDLTAGVTGVLPIANGGNGWTTAKVSASDATTTGQTLVDITGLSIATAIQTLYEFEALLYVTTSAVATGCEYGVSLGDVSPTNSVLAGCLFTGPVTGITAGSSHVVAFNTADTTAFLTTSGQSGVVWLRGFFYSGDGVAALSVRHLKVVSGTSTVKIGSWLRMRAA